MQPLTKGPNVVTIEDETARGGLSIFLGQQDEADRTRWRFDVYASTGDGLLYVGRFTSCPAHDGSQKTRLVATVAVPGATNYTVQVRPAERLGSEAQLYSAEVSLSVGDPGGQLPGVQRVNERPKYYAANAVGSVDIPAGERVVAWSAFATGAAASLVIGGGNTITFPPSGGVAGGNGGLLEGPVQFTFAGANFGGYYIETAESG